MASTPMIIFESDNLTPMHSVNVFHAERVRLIVVVSAFFTPCKCTLANAPLQMQPESLSSMRAVGGEHDTHPNKYQDQDQDPGAGAAKKVGCIH